MNKGKVTCEVLKEIRKQIADQNDIDYKTHECTFEGECRGTCPACESEIHYLENEIVKKKYLGKAVVLAGLSVGLISGLTGCGHEKQVQKNLQNIVKSCDSTITENTIQDTLIKDTIIQKTRQNIKPDIFDGMVVIDDVFSDDFPDVYRYVEVMPQFPGGIDQFHEFIKSEIKYPEICKNIGISGTCLVQYIVEPDSTLSNISVLVSVFPDLDAEAIRVISSSPKWIPGKQEGKHVRVYQQIPIKFTLE